MTVAVVGLGQPLAGDDGVGLVVAERAAAALGDAVRHVALREPLRLASELAGVEHAVVVDALVGAGEPGALLELSPDELGQRSGSSMSSHGVGLADALALAAMEGPTPRVRIVAICIAAPERLGEGLSQPVAAAVPHAVERVCELVRSLGAGG